MAGDKKNYNIQQSTTKLELCKYFCLLNIERVQTENKLIWNFQREGK